MKYSTQTNKSKTSDKSSDSSVLTYQESLSVSNKSSNILLITTKTSNKCNKKKSYLNKKNIH